MNNKELVDNIKLQLSFRKAKPLFIVENGSRAWGLDSKDSDYDIRLVYAHEQDDYLSLSEPKDTFHLTVDAEFNKAEGDDILYDIVGFDIKKFLKLLAKSNPTAVEWCNSPIVYFDDKFLKSKDLRRLADNPSNAALFYHYSALCRNVYKKYIESDNNVTSKRYLYALRGLVNATIARKISMSTVPITKIPMSFVDAVNMTGFDDDIKDEMRKLIKIKREGKEKEIIDRNVLFDNLIEIFLANYKSANITSILLNPHHRGWTAERIFKGIVKTIKV